MNCENKQLADMKKEKKFEEDCPISRALFIISGKWSLRLVSEIGIEKKRFGELKKGIEEISEKMLIQELKLLTENGILEKEVHNQIPPKVEYYLTDLGLQLLPLLDHIKNFGTNLIQQTPFSHN